MKAPVTRSTGNFFSARRDPWFALLIWGPLVGFLPLLLLTRSWEAAAVILVIYGLVGWIWFGTGYTVGAREMLIETGPMRWRIKLSEINHVKETKSFTPSAALALDRLEIRYSKFGKVYISPKEKERFLEVIRKRCPRADIIRDGSD